jgi:hypothetical protein
MRPGLNSIPAGQPHLPHSGNSGLPEGLPWLERSACAEFRPPFCHEKFCRTNSIVAESANSITEPADNLQNLPRKRSLLSAPGQRVSPVKLDFRQKISACRQAGFSGAKSFRRHRRRQFRDSGASIALP